MFKKIVIFLAALGPGIFLVGYNIGTGSVTSMASAGASYGMNLTWAVLLSCIFTYILIVTFGQYTLVTGNTAIQSFKINFGKFPAQIVLWSLIISEMVSSIGVMAIVSEVIHEYSKSFTNSGEGISTILITIVLAVILIGLLFNGKYSLIEKVLIVFVTIMGLSFLLTSFIVIENPSDVLIGMIPNIPNEANAGLIVAGMIGTTMGGVLYVIRSATIKEKNWTIADLKNEKKDAFVSALLMFLLSAAIMSAAAGTLYPKGLKIDNAIDMVKLLEPLAGKFAISLFVAGLVSAGISSLFPHYMLVPMLLSDYQNTKLDLSTFRNRGIVIFYALLGLVVPIFGGRPVLVMIISQALALIATPLILTLMWMQINNKKLLKEHSASMLKNIVMGLITLFTIYIAVIGLIGIIEL
ncbi:MAG: Nramp family divalent metal transporter [Ignavibacteriales bacterium]|nr:Nramp family divalent metal transporter [Ignavibacteriales bacterium]